MENSIQVQGVMTSKGQVTIPKVIRSMMKAGTGDIIQFTPQEDGTVLLEAVSLKEKKSVEFISDELFNSHFDTITDDFDDVFRKLVDL
jgi:AbrB family looped-hinge helix DNA binding protein